MGNILYIVLPAYNESANIIDTLNAWYPIVEEHSAGGKSRLVVVDDGSKDDTYKIMQEYSKEHPLFIPLKKQNGGHGPAVLYLYDFAVKQGADWIFQTDSDGQTNPAEFQRFWNDREKNDAIFGYRHDRGDGKSRAFVEKVVCGLVKYFFKVKVPDANAPFRLMKADKLSRYIKKLDKSYNLPNVMITTYFVYYGDKVKFRKISFKPRSRGVNSINIKKIIKIGYNSLNDFRKLQKEL